MRRCTLSARFVLLHRLFVQNISEFGDQQSRFYSYSNNNKHIKRIINNYPRRSIINASRFQGTHVEMIEIKDSIEVNDTEQKIFDELLEVVKQVRTKFTYMRLRLVHFGTSTCWSSTCVLPRRLRLGQRSDVLVGG